VKTFFQSLLIILFISVVVVVLFFEVLDFLSQFSICLMRKLIGLSDRKIMSLILIFLTSHN